MIGHREGEGVAVKLSVTRISFVALLVLGAMLVGCSSNDADESTSEGAAATATETDDADTEGSDVDEALAAQGRTLTAAQCWSCHSQDGSTSVGPTWKGLFGKTETLEDGSTVEVDEAYIRESILDPGAKVVQGFPAGAMPTFSSLTDEDLQAIVAYIKSLDD